MSSNQRRCEEMSSRRSEASQAMTVLTSSDFWHRFGSETTDRNPFGPTTCAESCMHSEYLQSAQTRQTFRINCCSGIDCCLRATSLHPGSSQQTREQLVYLLIMPAFVERYRNHKVLSLLMHSITEVSAVDISAHRIFRPLLAPLSASLRFFFSRRM